MSLSADINGFVLPHQTFDCPYIRGNRAVHESIIVEKIDSPGLDRLLGSGYRHFGPYFFRPVCTSCHQCIPIRIHAPKHLLSKNARRLMRKNSRLNVKLITPVPRPEFFRMFQQHKKRFDDAPQDTYQDYIDGFYYPSPFNHAMMMMYGSHMAAISHIDITDTAISAVYTYFDEKFAACSPGTYLIYQILLLAKRTQREWVYLGYYIDMNDHMNYKIRFKPNQLLETEERWVPYISADGKILSPGAIARGFHPKQPFPNRQSTNG